MKKLNFTRKLRALLLLNVFIWSCASMAYAQNLKLDFNNAPLKEVLAAITKESGYNFVYSEKTVNPQTKITISYSGNVEPIVNLLNKVFSGTNIAYKVNGKQVALSVSQAKAAQTAQAGVIKGNIKDEDGMPMPGVTIVNERTKKFATSDENGDYSIEAKEGDELSYSFIGMLPSKVTVGKGNIQDVLLKLDAVVLENVVVTGYQDIQKEKVTGAITTVSSKKIEERYTPNILTNLEGKVAGLTTYGGKTTIRGTSSLYAETNPLLVVDGLPIEGRIEDLNPYDIESINVLKDAAATAIYGARASNGIIVITTKNARKKGKIDIDFSANWTMYQKKNMDYADNFYMNAAEQVKVENDFYNWVFNGPDSDTDDPYGDVETAIAAGGGEISPVQWAYYQLGKGQITQAQFDAKLKELSNNNFAKEYADAVYKAQFMQQYNLALRSSSDKFQSNLTLNYKSDNMGIINAGMSQLNISYKGTYDIAKWLRASVSINSIYSDSKTAGYDYNSSHTNPWAVPAYETMYNPDGSYRNIYYWYGGTSYSPVEEGLHDLGVKIVDEFYNNTQRVKRNHTRYHADLQFKIIDGLTANAQFIYEDSKTTTDWHANAESHVARTIRNAYTVKDPATGKIEYLTPKSGGMLQQQNVRGSYWTTRGQLNYTKTFKKHSIAAIAGLEFRETLTNGTKSLILGYDEQLQNSSTHTIDFGKLSTMRNSPYYLAVNGGFPAQQFAFDPYMRDGMGIVPEQKHRFASGYANLTYTFDEKYNVFGSFRKDYADVYGLNAKFRGSPLWSVGAAWNINNEKFMQNVKWVDFLKLRFSYGVTGNIYQGATSYMTASSDGVNEFTNLPFGTIDSPANPNLKWEKNIITDIGIDFSLLDNRLRGNIDYYIKTGKDIFSNKTLDPSTGFTTMFVNMASMENKGVEVQLTYDWFRERREGGFAWATSLTFSHNKNCVTDVENPATTAWRLIDNPYKVGYPSSAMWSYRFAGISDAEGEKGQTLWYGNDGNKVHGASNQNIDVLEYSGQSDPVTVVGFDNRFSFKGFSLSILMAYYGGHKMRALPEEETFDVPYSALASYYNNAWTPENPTNTPGIGRYASTSIGSECRYSNISVHDASFLKIRNIVLGYDLPQRWINKIGINRASIRFQIDNPKALWVANDINVDPETLGIRNPSSYILGININL